MINNNNTKIETRTFGNYRIELRQDLTPRTGSSFSSVFYGAEELFRFFAHDEDFNKPPAQIVIECYEKKSKCYDGTFKYIFLGYGSLSDPNMIYVGRIATPDDPMKNYMYPKESA